jgi:CHASE3 domain sensor protein
VAMDIGNIVLAGIVILLIILFFVSFMMFTRRILINQSTKSNNSISMEKKLDKIIELLEKEKADK